MAADAPNSSSEDDLLDGVLHTQYTNTLESIADAVRHCAALVEAEGRSGSTTREEMRKNLRALLESVEAQRAAAPTVEDLAAQEKASAAAEVTRYWSKASPRGGGHQLHRRVQHLRQGDDGGRRRQGRQGGPAREGFDDPPRVDRGQPGLLPARLGRVVQPRRREPGAGPGAAQLGGRRVGVCSRVLS